MPGLDGEMGRSVVLRASHHNLVEKMGWVAGRGKPARANKTGELVGWGRCASVELGLNYAQSTNFLVMGKPILCSKRKIPYIPFYNDMAF